MKILIVSGGKTEHAFARRYLVEHEFDYNIAVDSGLEFFYRQQLVPDLLIGDFDSVSKEALSWAQEKNRDNIIRLIPQKDDTDTEAAIRQAIRKGAREIHILGSTGTRLDHVLGNIQLLKLGLDRGILVYLIDPHNRIRMIDGDIRIEKDRQYGKFVSLVPFTPEVTGISLRGFFYPLTDYCMKSGTSIGISNEITGTAGEIRLKSGIMLVIESKD